MRVLGLIIGCIYLGLMLPYWTAHLSGNMPVIESKDSWALAMLSIALSEPFQPVVVFLMFLSALLVWICRPQYDDGLPSGAMITTFNTRNGFGVMTPHTPRQVEPHKQMFAHDK